MIQQLEEDVSTNVGGSVEVVRTFTVVTPYDPEKWVQDTLTDVTDSWLETQTKLASPGELSQERLAQDLKSAFNLLRSDIEAHLSPDQVAELRADRAMWEEFASQLQPLSAQFIPIFQVENPEENLLAVIACIERFEIVLEKVYGSATALRDTDVDSTVRTLPRTYWELPTCEINCAMAAQQKVAYRARLLAVIFMYKLASVTPFVTSQSSLTGQKWNDFLRNPMQTVASALQGLAWSFTEYRQPEVVAPALETSNGSVGQPRWWQRVRNRLFPAGNR